MRLSPIRLVLSEATPTEAITVHNDGQAPTVVQVQALAWSQREGDDAYAATRDLIATPPIFTVSPVRPQTVRVGLRRKPDTVTELSYRLFFQEVPSSDEPAFQGLRLALRIGVPVFIRPTAPAEPELHWRLSGGAGSATLEVENRGHAHARVSEIYLRDGDRTVALEPSTVVVLARQRRAWVLRDTEVPGRSPVTLHTRSGSGEAFEKLVREN